MNEHIFFVGVDVGTRSVRAALMSSLGQVICTVTDQISVHNARPEYYEQSSNEIWTAVCNCVKGIVKGVDKKAVRGIGFDATCSLVVLDGSYQPVCVNFDDRKDYNVIMWMDHRAMSQAMFINSTNHQLLKYVGGRVSIEMQMPKLLWLKNNMSSAWNAAEHFMGLPDYLTFKATQSLSRSLCSLVCKWNYLCDGINQGWDDAFLSAIGLQELIKNNYSKIGNEVLRPGECVGYISSESALELGLCEGTPVSSSIIDAHAGGLALLYSNLKEFDDDICSRLGLICGTSTCYMCVSRDRNFVSGIWGPYFSAMIPGLWLNEGGQSATGSLVDHIVHQHPAVKFCPKDIDIYTWLEKILLNMVNHVELSDISFLTEDVHVYPDFHGNRSPLADPSFKGMICGMTLDVSIENLAVLYLATLQSIAYGARDILNQLVSFGYEIKSILMCGGLTNSGVFTQLVADITGLPVLIPKTKESVLLGSAILGAAASGVMSEKGDVITVASAMAGEADKKLPKSQTKAYHQKKFEVFKKMQNDQISYKIIMNCK